MTNFFGETEIKPMMALKLKQPFAALMLHGKIETRTWDTPVRGQVLLSSSLLAFTAHEMRDYCDTDMIEFIEETLAGDEVVKLLGCAYAVGNLVHTRRMKKSDEKQCFVNYQPHYYCHIYEDVKTIKPFIYTPVGIQKWKKVIDEETLRKIVYL